jgi:hypothetical protein
MMTEFEALKEQTFKALRESISGDADIIVNIMNALLDAQERELRKTYDNERINSLMAKIEQLEHANLELGSRISQFEK